jgi:hypothetical protein
LKNEAITNAFPIEQVRNIALPAAMQDIYANGYFSKRSGDIQFVLRPAYIDHGTTGTTHGAWNPYDAHIPLVWYGWRIKPGALNREVYMTDIAPTIAALLRIQMPNGSIGKVITELTTPAGTKQ